jgi:hypothetical protein
MSSSDTADYLRGLEDAAAIADFYATENFRLASDTVLTDPILSGEDRVSDAAWRKSETLMMDGHMHTSMAHAAQNIAEAIRSAMP